MTDASDSTWHERGDVAIKVDDTEVGREVLLYEYFDGDWNRRYAMDAGTARNYYELFGEIFPDE